jgi:5,10-methylene-tetrahydrofolate dehydrogenase/methenyl tetrahydrofolate cyclohydrolase
MVAGLLKCLMLEKLIDKHLDMLLIDYPVFRSKDYANVKTVKAIKKNKDVEFLDKAV